MQESSEVKPWKNREKGQKGEETKPVVLQRDPLVHSWELSGICTAEKLQPTV